MIGEVEEDEELETITWLRRASRSLTIRMDKEDPSKTKAIVEEELMLEEDLGFIEAPLEQDGQVNQFSKTWPWPWQYLHRTISKHMINAMTILTKWWAKCGVWLSNYRTNFWWKRFYQIKTNFLKHNFIMSTESEQYFSLW